jgi:hypothetical protein
MHTHTKALTLAVLGAMLFVAGYAVRRPERRGGDMLDAVAAVQRRAPMFVISDRAKPRAAWLREGGVYLSRTLKSHDDVEGLSKFPSRRDRRWAGVVYFKGCADRHEIPGPLVSLWPGECLDYGDFAVYGDRDLLREVEAILASEGFEAAGLPEAAPEAPPDGERSPRPPPAAGAR